MKQKLIVEIEVEAPAEVTVDEAWTFFAHIVSAGSLNASDPAYNHYKISAKVVEPEK